VDFLLDTSAFIWSVWEDNKLSTKARDCYSDEKNRIFLSLVSVWEMTIKYQIGKLSFKDNPKNWIEDFCRARKIEFLPISINDIFTLNQLPLIHKDPFDRILIAQAMANDMAMLTSDNLITQYDVKTIW
jgi:PIN domain nuclease of toxin-antitoxin system